MPENDPLTTNTDLYTTDFYTWCLTTAARVRAGQWEEIDLEALAEELESLAKREQRAVESRLEKLVMHLLKWSYQPERRSSSWYNTIVEQRNALARLLRDNPRFSHRLDAFLLDVYPGARRRALGEMHPPKPFTLPGERSMEILGIAARRFDPRVRARLAEARIPTSCPWSPEEILDHDFWPEH